MNDAENIKEESLPKDKHEHKKHKEELEKLNNENTMLKEEVLKSKAELINYRKRKDEEVSSMLRYASSDLITSFLSIKDNFERALKVDEDNLSPDTKSFLNGFKMIYQSINEILINNGVKEINPVGEVFDSKLENCLFTENDPSKENEIITEVFSKGYTYNDKILRCAQVKVNVINNINNKENDKNE